MLYICLCGFPPFSDELYSPENPFTLSQQIKMGRFDYPSPYWDSVGDLALDLIDRMLTVNVENRISIDDCLEHPWLTNNPQQQQEAPPMSLHDSTDGLPEALGKLDFSKRKVKRERTLLSAINEVKVDTVLDTQPGAEPVKVFDKNTKVPAAFLDKQAKKEASPAHARAPEEFVEMGGKGDEPLFADPHGSRYPDQTMNAENIRAHSPVNTEEKA